MNRSYAVTTTVLLPLLGLALAGCSAQQDVQLPAAVTTALEAAFNKGDIQACADLYTEDAVIIPEEGSKVSGREAIQRFFTDQVAREIAFDTDTTVSVVSGDLAVEQGTYRIRNVVRGVDVEYGDYLNVWRMTKGQWKAYRSMYNVTMSRGSAVSVSEDGDGS